MMSLRFLFCCGLSAAICASVSGVRADEYSNVELPELDEEEAIVLGARRVRISESTVVMATQGERLLVEFDRAVLGLRSTRSQWPNVTRVSGKHRKFVVYSSHAGNRSLSVRLVDGSAVSVHFVFLKGRRLPLTSQEKTTMSVVGHNGREKRFSVSVENTGDLQDVMEFLLPGHGVTIEKQHGRLVLQGRVPTEIDRSRLDAVAHFFFPAVENRLVTPETPVSDSRQDAEIAAGGEQTDSKVQQLTLEVEQLRHRVQELTSHRQASVLDDEHRVYQSDCSGFFFTPADCLIYFHRSFAGRKDPVVRALHETSQLYVARPWQDVDGRGLKSRFQVRTNPTLILVRDNQEVGRIEGEFTDDQVKQLLEAPQESGD